MKFFGTSFLTALALSSSTAYAGCYTGGFSPQKYRMCQARLESKRHRDSQPGDKDLINTYISGVCSLAGLGGNYNPLQERSFCLNSNEGYHYNFYIFNEYNAPHYMDPNGCVTYMQYENNGCEYGGDSTYSDIGWRFILDPDSGDC